MDALRSNPENAEIAERLRSTLLDIRIYQSGRSAKDLAQENIETLIAAGAFSPRNTAFLAGHQYQFHGFPTRIASDISVLDIVLVGNRFIGFADGHVQIT